MNLLQTLLPALREVAGNLTGTEFAGKAVQDVHDVEAIASKDASTWDAEVTKWLATRLHPAAAPTAQSTSGQATQHPAS